MLPPGSTGSPAGGAVHYYKVHRKELKSVRVHVCARVCLCVCVSLSVDDQARDGLGSDDICCSDVLPVKTTHVTGLQVRFLKNQN